MCSFVPSIIERPRLFFMPSTRPNHKTDLHPKFRRASLVLAVRQSMRCIWVSRPGAAGYATSDIGSYAPRSGRPPHETAKDRQSKVAVTCLGTHSIHGLGIKLKKPLNHF